MKIAIASDHRGVDLKNFIINNSKYEYIDLSPENTPTDDYPDFAYLVGKSVQNKEANLGVLVCRTGIGIAIAANKMKGIYCGRVVKPKDAILACHDNNINVMSISGEDMSEAEMLESIENFVNSERLNHERHVRRFQKIIQIETGEYNEL